MTRVGQLLFCAILGFGLSFAVIVAVLRGWRLRRVLPRQAELHHTHHPAQTSVPRLGGIALAVAFAAVLCLPLDLLFGCQLYSLRWVIAGAALAMFGLGLWDDLHALGAKYKLAGQLAIASAAYFLGLGIHVFKVPFTEQVIELGLASWPVTVLWLVAMTNLINLIDGVDGLAGGICLMLMALLTVVGGDTGCVPFIAAGMAGATLAFLRFNFPPARIYLGDSGAYFMGFLIGGLTIHTSHKGTVFAALIAPLFVLALPILDTSLAIFRRGLRGLPLFRPDRRHLHHRLLESGLSRRTLVLGAYAFTAFFLLMGLVVFWSRGQHLPLVLGGATLLILLLASRFGFSREWFAVVQVLDKSLRSRSEIQYAMAHANWLALEGARGGSIQGICEDIAFVTRKLGFTRLHIRLEDGEQTWELSSPCSAGVECARQPLPQAGASRIVHGSGTCQCYAFRHPLPGHPSCHIEFHTPDLGANGAERRAQGGGPVRQSLTPSKFGIISDVLAEGWAKSLIARRRKNDLPMRFYHQTQPPTAETAAGLRTTDH